MTEATPIESASGTELAPQSGPPVLPVAETLEGKHILVTGSTGFLGKVLASWILHELPGIGKLYLLIRNRRTASAEQRFIDEILESPALDPLRLRYSDGTEGFVRDRVEVVAGDVTADGLGMAEEVQTRLRKDLDLVINSAGLTDFNPPLEQSIAINTMGARWGAEFVKSCDKARLLHVSTCYVAGNHDGVIREFMQPEGYLPSKEHDIEHFDVERELDDCQAIFEEVRTRARTQRQEALFRQKARTQLERDNRDASDPEVFDEEVERQRKRWITKTLQEEGIGRAQHWGWPNIYTYSKSLGEQMLARFKDEIPLTIVRPSIIESSEIYPQPGWNEGINTAAPICFLCYKGIRYLPTLKDHRLDVVPVDYVVRAMVLASAALLRDEHEMIYQVSSSDRNPVRTYRIIELNNLSNRQHYAKRVSRPRWENMVMTSLDTLPVSFERYEWMGSPFVRKTAGGIAKLLGAVKTRQGTPLQRTISSVSRGLNAVEKASSTVERIYDTFMPFIYNNLYIFKAENIRQLEERLAPEESRFAFDIERLDWRDYWLDVQMPGFHKWVFPKLDLKLKEERRLPTTYDDLVELFEASARNHADRPALQMLHESSVERYTYADLQMLAERAAERLQTLGLAAGGRVMLLSENRPQWGITYLGVLKAGAACIPVDPEMAVDGIVHLIESAQPFAMVISEKTRERLEEKGITPHLEANPSMRVLGFSDLLHDDAPRQLLAAPEGDEAMDATRTSSTALVRARQQKGDIASLIFTSGTTGTPKGVMLTHKNFTSLIQSLNRTFKVSSKDGFLSVLPLHHTFEFTCGFLLPLSRGATITYLDELSPEALNRGLEDTNVTVMIGVPALWQLFHRRITSEINGRGEPFKSIFNTMLGINRVARRNFNVNLGPVIFSPVFKRFGGKIRYLISGGASLPPSVFNTFEGLGFTLLEGYGLTEAAPVLTCNRRGDMRAGSVGKALPGVTIEIVHPNADGVGEIRATGPNVMMGYLDAPDKTAQVLRDDWLYTGDLGRIDRSGRLYIVGRQKDVIISASGKNVYPDELEDFFGKHEAIEELAVVGLPDGQGSEYVGCLVRPKESWDYDEAIKAVRRHIKVENTRLPFYQRIKRVEFTREELPRTATRKVKRDLVQARLLEEHDSASVGARRSVLEGSKHAWLIEVISDVTGAESESISQNDELVADLGMDSLMLAEMVSRVEELVGVKIDLDELNATASVGDLVELLKSEGASLPEAGERPVRRDKHGMNGKHQARSTVIDGKVVMLPTLPDHDDDESTLLDRALPDPQDLPEPMVEAGRSILNWAQKNVYEKGFNVKVYGRANIPYNRPAIVVANHSSHLDMGLVKYALWDFAPRLSALAASDYFFSSPAKRAYFSQFTNLIAVERSGSLEASLARAGDALMEGVPVLIFPEGTRSTTGDIQPFRRGVGYLAVRYGVDILPVYIRGTHRALPKGKVIPRRRRLEVRIGESLTPQWIAEQTQGMRKSEAYRHVSELTREAILALKGGRRFLDESAEDRAFKEQKELLTEIVEWLKNRLVPDSVDALVTYYFSLGDFEGARWTLELMPESCRFKMGKPAGRADCVLKCTPDMFRRITQEGYTPAMEEFMNGTVKTNDPNLLMLFKSAFAL